MAALKARYPYLFRPDVPGYQADSAEGSSAYYGLPYPEALLIRA
jgi:hypothetical protein